MKNLLRPLFTILDGQLRVHIGEPSTVVATFCTMHKNITHINWLSTQGECPKGEPLDWLIVLYIVLFWRASMPKMRIFYFLFQNAQIDTVYPQKVFKSGKN